MEHLFWSLPLAAAICYAAWQLRRRSPPYLVVDFDPLAEVWREWVDLQRPPEMTTADSMNRVQAFIENHSDTMDLSELQFLDFASAVVHDDQTWRLRSEHPGDENQQHILRDRCVAALRKYGLYDLEG